jgi:hypothetical protein
MEQSPLKWFELKYEEMVFAQGTVSPKYTFFLIEQAKLLEKEQRIKDYNAGYTDAQCNHINDAENYASEQEYLNSRAE